MNSHKQVIASVSLLAVAAAVGVFFLLSGERPAGEGASAARSATEVRRQGGSAGRDMAQRRRVRSETAIDVAAAPGRGAVADDDEYRSLSSEMRRIIADLQDSLDAEDRRSLSRICDKLSKIRRERGYGAVPAVVRAKAVEAIGLFLPDSLVELAEFMDDPEPEVAESAFDQLDILLNDTTIGDNRLSDMLVSMSKVLVNEDAIDSMALSVDINMRNSVKVRTLSQMLDAGTEPVVEKIRETIANTLEVEVEELPANSELVKQQLVEWLAENPDGEDDPEFYKGVED